MAKTDVAERNYAKDVLTLAEVKRILKAVGSVSGVLNTRHKIAKERGWKERPPSKADFAQAVLTEPNLLRRPILLAGDGAVVGKDESGYRELLG